MRLNHIVAAFLFFSAGLAVLQAMGELLVQRTQVRHRLGAAIYTCLAITLLHASYYLVLRGEYAHAYQLQIPFAFALGPAVYQFILIALELREKYQKIWLLQFLPALLSFLILVPVYVEPALSKSIRMHYALLNFWSDPANWVFAGALLHTFGYFLYLSVFLGRLWLRPDVRRRQSVRLIMGIVLYAFALSLISVLMLITRSKIVALIILCGMAAVVPGLYLIGRRYPDFLYGLTEIVRRESYNHTQLRGVRVDKVLENLKQLMEYDELYREDDLSLTALAGRLQLTGHQLSELFNVHLQQNFASFVNSYRITEACRLLKEEPDRTILSVAYESGFSSRSAFQNAFIKQVGMNPSRYKKNQSGRA